MKKPEILTDYCFTDTRLIPDGYDVKRIPDNSVTNFNTLIKEHNNLVECFNALSEHIGFDNFGE